ncbi:MAG TPA: hypothetical protein VFE84_02675, partial [Patescibacteria group bacterium]|nr:hypothetical protein [Patescibacteria group bacterium]
MTIIFMWLATASSFLAAPGAGNPPAAQAVPTSTREEAPLGFEVDSAQAACARLAGSPRDGEPPLPVLITLEAAGLR